MAHDDKKSEPKTAADIAEEATFAAVVTGGTLAFMLAPFAIAFGVYKLLEKS